MSLSFLEAAAASPDRIALVASGVPHTYAALSPHVRGAVAELQRHGVVEAAREHPVAVLVEDDPETFVLLHALMETGTAFLPLSPRLTELERRETLARLGASTLLAGRPGGDAAWELIRLGPGAREGERAPFGAWIAAAPTAPAVASATPAPVLSPLPDDERPLAVLLTAGTTGRPKGVVLSRRAFAASARASAQNLGWHEDDRWLLCLSLNHVGGLSILTRCVLARATVVLAPPGDPDAIADAIARDRATLVSLVPAMLQRLLDRRGGWTAPPRLRAILLGGAAASTALLARAAGAGLPVLATYGLTEACSQVATQRLGIRYSPEEGCGEPLPDVEVRIVEGRIQVRGPMLFSGYVPREERADPFLPEGWFDTGDCGRLDERGRLHMLGRADEVIVTGGEKVHPREVEEALERCPGVAAACVFGVKDETWGEVVAAALVAAPGGPPSDEELARFLVERLATWKRPRLVTYLPGIPLTAAGKHDREATRRLSKHHLRAARAG